MRKRIAFLWFEHLALERFGRHERISTPFALTLHQNNAERIYALNKTAQQAGLVVGMGVGEARILCPLLKIAPVQLEKDWQFLQALARFAQRFCPWVGIDGVNGLVLDITGSSHLWGGEQGFVQKAKGDFSRLGLSLKIGIAPTYGAAWALAHFREGAAEDARESLSDLPIAALRISEANEILARRLGLHQIGDLYDKPRAEMVRRFGQDFILKLDQALGAQFENISPIGPPRIFATRMNFPEPIGFLSDVMAGLERLLTALSEKLVQHGQAMQALAIGLRMSDGKWHNLFIRFARPMQGNEEILPLTEPKIAELDAGFGFDLMRLEARVLTDWNTTYVTDMGSKRAFEDLLSKIGNRIGFENIQKLSPRDHHWPEKASVFQGYEQEVMGLSPLETPRPLLLYPLERLAIHGAWLPKNFIWRRMKFRVGHFTGPERLAPEWWCEDNEWKQGVRDYWRVATFEGRRLWLFYTPQNPAWYVHGEFA